MSSFIVSTNFSQGRLFSILKGVHHCTSVGMYRCRLLPGPLVASFPGSSRNVHAWRAWYPFSRDHDVIKIGPEYLEQKGNVLRVIQPTLRSMLGVYDICPPIAIYV